VPANNKNSAKPATEIYAETSVKAIAEPAKPAVLKETIMTPDGQVVQITTKPAPTPRGVPNASISARTRKRHKEAVAKLLDTDEVVKDQVNGFVNFIREHAIVGLAVGFGAQAQAVVKQLVTSFVDPVIQLFFGGAKLTELKAPVHLFGNSAAFEYGAFIYALINLLSVLVTIYVLIKVLKLDKLDQPKAKTDAAAKSKKSKK
jgi:large-conductance mechanosensitive channel